MSTNKPERSSGAIIVNCYTPQRFKGSEHPKTKATKPRRDYLVLHYEAGHWDFPKGHVEGEETAEEAAIREIEEETGLTPEKMWVAPKVNSFYSAVSDTICLIPVFAAQVAKDSNVIISAEHSECTWVNPREAKELLAWDGQRRAIDLIEEYYLNEKSLLKFIKIDL